MARPIVLGNGELHIGLNNYGLVHDVYFPYVGLENHAKGPKLRHKMGVWVNDKMSWLDEDSNWSFSFEYQENALIGHTTAINNVIGVRLELHDAVDSDVNAFLREIRIMNLSEQPQDIRLFLHQAFAIGDSRSNTDTSQYLPDSDAILHYRGLRAIVAAAECENGDSFDQHSIRQFGFEENDDVVYKDAEDGELDNNNVGQGRVDSILRFKLTMQPHSSRQVNYWLALAKSSRDALDIHKDIQKKGLANMVDNTAKWWADWLKPGLVAADKVPKDHNRFFINSLMIIKSQIDNRGAVIASTDSSLLNYDLDDYAYCWPRDAAYVLWPLIRLGFKQEAHRFFIFCKETLHNHGYLMHKFRADGSLGSSWHPYIHGETIAPPIQEDETAIVALVFVEFYKKHKDINLISDFYETMIKPMGDFMSDYIDDSTGLPKPSYDLWEQSFLTSTYTTANTYGSLVALSELADMIDDRDSAIKWQNAAHDIKSAAKKHLFNHERQVMYKGIYKDGIRDKE